MYGRVPTQKEYEEMKAEAARSPRHMSIRAGWVLSLALDRDHKHTIPGMHYENESFFVPPHRLGLED